MADFLTHQLFGQKVFITEEAVPLVLRREDTPAYLWGQQGPDLFFYRRAITGRPLAPLASRLHSESPGPFFDSAARYVQAQQGRFKEISMAYFAGLLCHYVLDRDIHPYVNARAKDFHARRPDLSLQALHIQIETDMDMDLYALWRKAPIRDFHPWDDYFLDDAQREAVARMWNGLLLEVYKLSLDPGEVPAALDDTLTYAKMLYRGGSPLHLLAVGAETLISNKGVLSGRVKHRRPRWDSLNLGAAPWTDARGQVRTDTVPDLLARAEGEVRQLMADYTAMWAAGEVTPLVFAENYSGTPIPG